MSRNRDRVRERRLVAGAAHGRVRRHVPRAHGCGCRMVRASATGRGPSRSPSSPLCRLPDLPARAKDRRHSLERQRRPAVPTEPTTSSFATRPVHDGLVRGLDDPLVGAVQEPPGNEPQLVVGPSRSGPSAKSMAQFRSSTPAPARRDWEAPGDRAEPLAGPTRGACPGRGLLHGRLRHLHRLRQPTPRP